MKTLTTFLLLSLSLTFFAQEKKALEPYDSPLLQQIDEDFVQFMFSLVEINKTASSDATVNSVFAAHHSNIAKQYQKADNPKFDFLISYYTQLSKRNKDIFKDEFLSKPSLNNLFSIYLAKELEYNSFGGEQRIPEDNLIVWEVRHFPTEHSLLLHYYNTLFYHVSQNNLLTKSFDINFGKLGLTYEEGTILYYALLFRIFRSDKFEAVVSQQKCKPFAKAALTLPTFNGGPYYKFKPAQLLEIVNTIRHQNKSWDVLPAYTRQHKEIIDLHKRCNE